MIHLTGFHQKRVVLFSSWRTSPFRGRGERLTILGYNNDQAVILVKNESLAGYVAGDDTSTLSGSDVNMLRFIASRRNLNLRSNETLPTARLQHSYD